MADYAFGTRWIIEAPLQSVWEAIAEPELWPRWWDAVREAEVVDQGGDGAGQRVRYAFRSELPYTLSFESVVRDTESPHTVVADVTGDLEGVGRWDVAEEGGVTVLDNTWDVRTTKPVMNVLAPLLRPVFVWNHHRMMRQGAEGLARRVGARLVRVDSSPGLGVTDWAPLVGLALAVVFLAYSARPGRGS